MSILLFKLNNVGFEEAEDVRKLLNEHEIKYYETDAGRWGISIAALWLVDKQQLPQAQQLLTEYQSQRSALAQAANKENEGAKHSILAHFKQAPLQCLVLIAAIIAITYFSIAPFITIEF
ncbi:MAG: DUF6164 family protein [Spongiibacteraceae bacterium]|jgi:hypothetical protein